MASMATAAVMGIIPPENAEARLALRWPTVAAFPGVARIGCGIQETATKLFRATLNLPLIAVILLVVPVTAIGTLMAFAAWGIMAPFYFAKVLPFVGKRYLLTNRRLMIAKGLGVKPVQEVKLEEIDEVRIVPGTEMPFFLAADLEVISAGKPIMVLKGVSEYQGFIVNIQNAYLAWGRKVQPKEQIQPASAMK